MEFYVSKTNNSLNGKEFSPELITKNVCVNPSRKVKILNGANILLDSGAYQDVRKDNRLSFQGALNRQLKYESKANFTSELLVSYDRLVDEKHDNQMGLVKERVGTKTGEKYVEETIDAAKFLADQREDLKPRKLLLSIQGVNTKQYLYCLKEMLKFTEPTDVIGFGGFCIVGSKPKYEPLYFETLEKSATILKKKNIKRIHIFGIGKFKLLVRSHMIFREFGISPSYDTSSYDRNAVLGGLFNPYSYRLSYVYPHKEKKKSYHPADFALLNIKMVDKFWEEFNNLYPIG